MFDVGKTYRLADGRRVQVRDAGGNYLVGYYVNAAGKYDLWNLDGSHDFFPELALLPLRRSLWRLLRELIAPRSDPKFVTRRAAFLCRWENHRNAGTMTHGPRICCNICGDPRE